jgi:hypothetical protein
MGAENLGSGYKPLCVQRAKQALNDLSLPSHERSSIGYSTKSSSMKTVVADWHPTYCQPDGAGQPLHVKASPLRLIRPSPGNGIW